MVEPPYEEEVTAELKPWWVIKDRYQWVLFQPCGCVTSVLEGECARNWLEALNEFYEDNPDQAQVDLERGVRVFQVTHEEYVQKYHQHMGQGYECPHNEPRAFWRHLWDALTGRSA